MNAIHGQDSWRAQHVSEEYGDHSAWDVRTIVEILGKFFDASQGTSLPELAEYNWRLDKVTTLHYSWKKRLVFAFCASLLHNCFLIFLYLLLLLELALGYLSAAFD